ncbi:MAG: flagellar hook-basal body complex protein [Sedimentisphaerales bacterium]|nr:flagellar hook-basal body complex protein [Sedimentisphaerales bacterium]
MGALAAGVTGLKAHQTMLDVAGNNLANVNTIGYKSSNVTFAELLSQTLKKASGPVGSLGGTNPQQMGSGVGVAAIARNMSQGNLLSTGQDLDVAIDGEGYFVLNDGDQNVYTRIGSFSVDSDNTLVDPATGNKVQRIGTYGESEGFQTAGDTSIHIPWDASMPAQATTSVTMNGNLRSSASATDATYHKLTSDLGFTYNSGANVASLTTELDTLDQFTVAGTYGTISITGLQSDGSTALAAGDFTVTATSTVQDLLSWVSGKFPDATATLNSSGQIELTGDDRGYSQAMITGMSYTPGGGESFTVPTFFNLTTPGGNDSKSFNITVYDSTGEPHVMSGYLVKTDTTNAWDLVVPAVGGETSPTWSGYDITSSTFNRRISGIQFNSDGSYAGLSSSTESLAVGVQFSTNPGVTQSITFDLGTEGEFTGLTQFYSEQSSANALSQDGYQAGELSGISIDQSGMVVGTFTNGVKRNVAAIQIATFQNPGGLEAIGDGYFLTSANSGSAVATMAATGGAGTLRGGSLEGSNVDVATEFVNMMQAQNGYQANARTIRVANDILRELTNLIR